MHSINMQNIGKSKPIKSYTTLIFFMKHITQNITALIFFVQILFIKLFSHLKKNLQAHNTHQLCIISPLSPLHHTQKTKTQIKNIIIIIRKRRFSNLYLIDINF